jgi:hypothetical protein
MATPSGLPSGWLKKMTRMAISRQTLTSSSQAISLKYRLSRNRCVIVLGEVEFCTGNYLARENAISFSSYFYHFFDLGQQITAPDRVSGGSDSPGRPTSSPRLPRRAADREWVQKKVQDIFPVAKKGLLQKQQAFFPGRCKNRLTAP